MRCAFCHDALDPFASPCAGCGTQLHEDCWDLLGRSRCPTLGCRGGLVRQLNQALGMEPAPARLSGELPLLPLALCALVVTVGSGAVALLNPFHPPAWSGLLFGVGALAHLFLIPSYGLAQDFQRRGAGWSMRRASALYGAAFVLLSALAVLLVVALGSSGNAPIAALVALASFAGLPAATRHLAIGLFAEDLAPSS